MPEEIDTSASRPDHAVAWFDAQRSEGWRLAKPVNGGHAHLFREVAD